MQPSETPVTIPVTHKVEGVVLDEIRLLSHTLTPARMRELMLDNAPQDWGHVSHEHATKVLSHLREMKDYHTDFTNLIIGWNERFQHPAINARGAATLTPELVDSMSKRIWR